VKELQGFEKVFLKAGEEKQVRVQIDAYVTSFWDESEEKWCSERGSYKVIVSLGSGGEGAVEARLEIAETKWWIGL
jgi:beta-glucosidase